MKMREGQLVTGLLYSLGKCTLAGCNLHGAFMLGVRGKSVIYTRNQTAATPTSNL